MSIAVDAALAWCVLVPHQAHGVRTARRDLVASISTRLSAERLADATAVLAELVGNSIRHAAPLPGAMIQVGWRLLPTGGLLIRVVDGGPPDGSTSTPLVRPPSTDAVDGRGLAIVAALSARWGVEPVPGGGRGQCVWAELR